MVNLELLKLAEKLDILWQKFRSGGYGDVCGQYEDGRRKKISLNSFLLKFSFGCFILFCVSVISLTEVFQSKFSNRFFGLYFVGIFALLTALCVAAIILSLNRVWNKTKYKRLEEVRKLSERQYIYCSKPGRRTMEEFSSLLAEKLTLLQKTRKDS